MQFEVAAADGAAAAVAANGTDHADPCNTTLRSSSRTLRAIVMPTQISLGITANAALARKDEFALSGQEKRCGRRSKFCSSVEDRSSLTSITRLPVGKCSISDGFWGASAAVDCSAEAQTVVCLGERGRPWPSPGLLGGWFAARRSHARTPPSLGSWECRPGGSSTAAHAAATLG